MGTKSNSKSCIAEKIKKIVIKEDPLVDTQSYKEYALYQNFIRSKFIGVGIVVISSSTIYDILKNHTEYNYFYLLSLITLSCISIFNFILVSSMQDWCLARPRLTKFLVFMFWISFMVVDFPKFLIDATTTYQTLNVTTWLAGMGFFLVLKRKNIIFVYLLFLLLNLGIAFFSHAPFHFFVCIITRTVLTAVVAFLLLYPYNIAVVRNMINSMTDPLSGLINRREGEKRIHLLLETNKRTRRYTALYMLDIDDFKLYNDNYGHQKGDETIVLVANSIKETFSRGEDINIRYGGEEFLICASVESHKNAEAMAARLHEQIKKLKIPDIPEQFSGCITVSIGFVVAEPETEALYNAKELINAADMAMYDAKKKGKNCTVQFSKETHQVT